MKVYFNRKPVSGPWGGGNKTLKLLVNSLQENITFNLTEDVDVIFCVDPRPDESGLWYQDFLDHRTRYGSKIIQRVGDVGTHGKPELTDLVKQSIQYSDLCIFPSQWAFDYVNASTNSIVIPNAPLSDFYQFRNESLKIDRPIRVVTHHWSDNDKKGFDVYSSFKDFVGEDFYFTYIGRYSNKYSKEGIDYVGPRDTESLKSILPEHDIYLTASQEEAGANHVLEAIACGLPVVYREGGGSIEEYCSDYGVGYKTIGDLQKTLEKIESKYSVYKKQVLSYTRTNLDLVKDYMEVLNGYI